LSIFFSFIAADIGQHLAVYFRGLGDAGRARRAPDDGRENTTRPLFSFSLLASPLIFETRAGEDLKTGPRARFLPSVRVGRRLFFAEPRPQQCAHSFEA